MSVNAEVSKDSWFTVEDETNYAGGKAGAEFSETKLTDGDGQSVGIPIVNEKPSMPLTKYERVEVTASGDGESDVHIFNKNTNENPGQLPFYLHDNYYLEKALTGNQGDVLDSFVTHWEDRIRRWESFGCVVEEIVISSNPTDFPRQDVKLHHYSTKTATSTDTTVDSLTKVAFTTTQPKIHKDFSMSIDGVSTQRDFAWTLTITNIFDKTKQNGQYEVQYPVLISRRFKLEVSTRKLDDTIRQEDQTESDDQTKIIVISGFPSSKTLTLTNMRVTETNSHEFPKFGVLDFTTTYEIAGSFSYTFA